MLSINFEDFRRRYPHLKGAFNALESFLDERPSLKHIDPLRVLYKRPELSSWELGLALSVLAEERVLQEAYAVLGPDRSFARGGYYKSREDVPKTLYDAFDDPFDREEGELVPIFTGGPAR